MAPFDGSVGNLPMGYKFRPTDDELLGYYLLNKVRSTSFMYDNVVPEVDLYGTLEPWDIWNAFGGQQQLEKGEKDLYFFTKLKSVSATDSRFARGIGTGTWLGENVGKDVYDPRNNQLLGKWKRLHYKNTSSPEDGCWIMHEYSLAPSIVKKLKSNSSSGTSTNDDEYVLCRVRINDKKREMDDDAAPVKSRNRRIIRKSDNKALELPSGQSSVYQPQYCLDTQGTSTAGSVDLCSQYLPNFLIPDPNAASSSAYMPACFHPSTPEVTSQLLGSQVINSQVNGSENLTTPGVISTSDNQTQYYFDAQGASSSGEGGSYSQPLRSQVINSQVNGSENLTTPGVISTSDNQTQYYFDAQGASSSGEGGSYSQPLGSQVINSQVNGSENLTTHGVISSDNQTQYYFDAQGESSSGEGGSYSQPLGSQVINSQVNGSENLTTPGVISTSDNQTQYYFDAQGASSSSEGGSYSQLLGSQVINNQVNGSEYLTTTGLISSSGNQTQYHFDAQGAISSSAGCSYPQCQFGTADPYSQGFIYDSNFGPLDLDVFS